MAAVSAASSRSWGSAAPLLSASIAFSRQVEGMNCIGPTARSYVVMPSIVPWSVSRISCRPPLPSSGRP